MLEMNAVKTRVHYTLHLIGTVISRDCLNPVDIEDSVTIDVTASDDTLLPPPPAVPTPSPTTRTTRSG